MVRLSAPAIANVPGKREGIRNLEQSMARPRGLLRQATTATAQALRAAGVRTSRRSALAETRRITATAAIRSRRSGPITTRLPTIITAAIRSRALTIRRPRPRTRRRELIPHRAAAIRRLHVPTLRPAAAEVAIAVAEGAVEAVEAPALTATINLLARHNGPAR